MTYAMETALTPSTRIAKGWLAFGLLGATVIVSASTAVDAKANNEIKLGAIARLTLSTAIFHLPFSVISVFERAFIRSWQSRHRCHGHFDFGCIKEAFRQRHLRLNYAVERIAGGRSLDGNFGAIGIVSRGCPTERPNGPASACLSEIWSSRSPAERGRFAGTRRYGESM